MKNLIVLFAILILCAGCSGASKAVQTESLQTDGEGIYEETLSNGLKVILLQDKSAPLAVFQIWYDAGSIHEQVGKTGLSHLLEHMMFKGTPRFGEKTFSKIIKRAGGIDNAGTSKDYVYYFQKLAPDRLSLSIEMEADRMQNLIMDEKEAMAERDVVMEERRMRYEDDPQSMVYEEVISTAFKNHPYGWPVIGWMEDLKTLTRDELWEYYKTRYVPNNAFVIIAGNIDPFATMEKIRSEFGVIPKGPEPKELNIQEPVQRGERRVYVKKEAELPYVMSAYKTPNILHEDTYALDMLAFILSGGKSARMYRSLVDEQRIALSAGAGYSNFNKYDHLFYLYGTAMPGKSIDDVEQGLYAEVEKIKKEPPAEREIQKAKNQLEADFIMDQDSIYYRAMLIAQFEMIDDRSLKKRYIQGIREVTAEDVQRVALKYLVEDQRTVGTLIPIKNKK